MKRMTKILTNSNDKNKPAISSSPSATSLPRKSDEAPHLDLNLTTENSFGGGIRAAAAAAGRDSPAPAPAPGAPTNLASILEARKQAYFDLPAMASTPNLPIYSTMPRTPMALSPHATGQTTMMSQPDGLQSIGQMGAVQYLANPAQPKTSPSRPQSNRASPSQDAVTSAAAAASPVERADLHKSLKSLEVLLVQLDEYRELQSTLAKVEKKLFKSCAELAKNNKGVIASAPSAALQHSAAIFEAQHEVSSKHAKMVQKEYEALNEACAKYFKKVAKEERTHEDLVQNLEIKVRKVQSTYDDKKAQSGPRALEAHDRYIATMSGLTNDIAKAKSSHAASIGVKSHSTALLVASTVGGLAEASFRAQCETVRRSGPSVGPLASSVNFCASEAMPTNMPLDLTEEEVGMAAHYAVAEAQAAEAQRLAREAALHQVRQQAVSDWKQQHDEQQQQYAALAAQVMHSGQDPSVALSEKHQGSRQQQQQLLAAALPRLDSSGREIGDGNGRDFRVGASYYQNEAPNQCKRAGTVVEEDEEEDEQEASKAAATGSRAGSASSAGPSGLQAAASGMQRETSVHSRHSQAAEPTFIDHGASKEESMAGAEEAEPKPTRDVKSATPSPSPSLQREASQQSQAASLSAGEASAAGSGSAISSLSSSSSTTAASPYPRTPDEGEALPGAFPSSSTAAIGGRSVPPAVPEESESAAAAAPSPVAASLPRFASPRPIRGSPSPTPTPTPTKVAPTSSTTAAPAPPTTTSPTLSPSPSLKHKWEQERERSRAKRREAELEKRLREAEDRLRLVERANVPPAASTSSSTLLPPRQPMPHRRDSAPIPVGVGSYPTGSMAGTRPGAGAPRSVSGTYGMQQRQQDDRSRQQQPRSVSPQPLYRQEASSLPPTASSSTDSSNSQHQLSSYMYRPQPRDRDHHLTAPYDSRDRRHATPPDERDRRDDLQYHAAQQRQRRRQSSTESERSFVARMKAHYQAEREKNSPSASSPYRADAAAGRRGSVSPYGEEERGYGGGGGGRGNGEKQWRRATMQVPPPASQSQSQARSEVGEFGEYSQQRRAPSPYQQPQRSPGYGDGFGGGPSSLSVGRETPRHSDICGCQSCSARHYATDSVKARSAAAAVGATGGGRGGEMGGRGGDGRGTTAGRVSGGGSSLFAGRG